VIGGTAIAVRTENTESRIGQQLHLAFLIFKKAGRPLSCSKVSYTKIVDLHPPELPCRVHRQIEPKLRYLAMIPITNYRIM
jgi:hypothetical protein